MTSGVVVAREINELLRMDEVARLYGFEIKRRKYISCPFHSEETPSLRLYDHNWYCFGCGAGGDVIKFVQRYFNIGVQPAIVRLNYDFNLGFPLDERPDASRRAKMRLELIERKNKEMELKQEKEAADRLYAGLWNAWIELDRQQEKYKPKGPGETPSMFFVETLRGKQYIENMIDSLP